MHRRRRVYTSNINIRLRPGEKEKIDSAARSLGLPTSWWIRRVLLGAAISESEDRTKAAQR